MFSFTPSDNISSNIETTYNDVEQGNSQLRQAGTYAVCFNNNSFSFQKY